MRDDSCVEKGATSPRSPNSLESIFEDLEREVEELQSKVDRVFNKLIPILRDEESVPANPDDIAFGDCDLGTKMRRIVKSVNEASNAISRLSYRIDL